MSDHFSATGKCLCNAVTFEARSAEKKIGACHCNMCRAWAGGPFMGLDCGTDVSFSGEINTFRSSQWAERGFCPQCGTHLFYRIVESGQTIIPVGLFEEPADLEFDHQVFIDEKPGYYGFANQTKNMTGAEVFEMFAPKE